MRAVQTVLQDHVHHHGDQHRGPYRKLSGHLEELPLNPTLAKAADILPGILRNAIPKPSGPGYLLELEGAELDALRELCEALNYKGEDWVHDLRHIIRYTWKPFRNGEEGHKAMPDWHIFSTEVMINGKQTKFEITVREQKEPGTGSATRWPREPLPVDG